MKIPPTIDASRVSLTTIKQMEELGNQIPADQRAELIRRLGNINASCTKPHLQDH